MFFHVSQGISLYPERAKAPLPSWGIAKLCWKHAASITTQAAVSFLSRYRGYSSLGEPKGHPPKGHREDKEHDKYQVKCQDIFKSNPSKIQVKS